MYARLCERARKDPEGDCGGKDWVLPICCALMDAQTRMLHASINTCETNIALQPAHMASVLCHCVINVENIAYANQDKLKPDNKQTRLDRSSAMQRFASELSCRDSRLVEGQRPLTGGLGLNKPKHNVTGCLQPHVLQETA